MIINAKFGKNTERYSKNIESSDTIKKVLQDENIDYNTTTILIDGAPLSVGEINKTFDELGVTETVYINAVVKASNAR